jgi:hypothetical protein
MSFWTGLATGLARSVDQGLQKAMSKRDDELSRAKTFWQTRQAQKLDQKDAYDARAEKALQRMIREAGDDTTLGLAAFNAAGGDPDSVEALIKRIDDTRANKGKYNLLDSLKTADGKPITAGETTIGIEDALKSVRMQMKGIESSNIKIDDPLNKYGLGLRGGAAEKVAESVNAMIPPETVEKLTGIPRATLDMSNMIDAEKYANEQKLVAKQLTPTLAEGNDAIVQELMSLDPTAEDYSAKSAALIDKQNIYLDAMGKIAQAKDTGTTGSVTTSVLNTMYRQQLTANLAGKGINTKDQTYLDENGNIMAGGSGFIAAVDNATSSFNDTYVAALQRDDGSFGPAAIGLIQNNPSLTAASDKLTGKEDTSKSADTKKSITPMSFEEQQAKVQANPMGALSSFIKSNGNKATPDAMLNMLRKYGYKDDEAVGLIQEAMKQKETVSKKPSFADLTKTKAKGNVQAIDGSTGLKLVTGSAAYNKWMAENGATHNTDGTPK